MKLEARFGGETFEIDVNKLSVVNGCQRLEIRLKNSEGEQSYMVELLGRHRNRWTFKFEHAIEDFVISRRDQNSVVDWKNRLFAIEISSCKQRRLHHIENQEHPGTTSLRAQMPGKIIRVLKHVGEIVAKGEGVVIVEAMKMQNEITSPREGVLTFCALKEGERVGTGDLLFEIE